MTKASPKAKASRSTGRPSKRTPEVVDEIVQRISAGEPLAEICRDDHMPCADTVREWQRNDEALSRVIARARRDGFDAIAHRARRTARGDKETGDSTGDVQRDKLIIDTDLKLLAKWDPKRYGEKVALVGGDDGDAPIRTVRRIERVIVDPQDRNA